MCCASPVLSSTVAYQPSAGVEWKAYIASDGVVSAAVQRQIARGVAAEASLTALPSSKGGEQSVGHWSQPRVIAEEREGGEEEQQRGRAGQVKRWTAAATATVSSAECTEE